MLRLLRLDGIEVGCWEWFREGRGGGGGVGGERLRQLDGALYAGRQEGDPGRSWSWYRWSYLEQYLLDDVISAVLVVASYVMMTVEAEAIMTSYSFNQPDENILISPQHIRYSNLQA